MLKQYVYIALIVGFGIQMVFGDFYVLKEYRFLYSHYEQHKACYGDSFYNFVDKHYGNQKDDHARKHHDTNHRIPFGSHSFEFHQFVLAPFARPSFEYQGTLYQDKSKTTFYKNNCHKWLFHTAILQPPKNVIFNI